VGESNNEGTLLLFLYAVQLHSGLTVLPEAPIFGHQYRWSDDPTCVCLATAVVQVDSHQWAKHPRGRPKLQIVIAFSLLFLFILFMHLCKDCQGGFSAITPKGLKLHQRRCRSFLKHEAAANERRKATAASKEVRRTKLKERKERLGSAALGVRFL
jgi:hypothetical protein